MRLGGQRCGCDDCLNPTEFDPCGFATCSTGGEEGCPGGPCAFAVLFGTQFTWPPGEYRASRPEEEYIWASCITVLWTDCKFQGKTYTARKRRQVVEDPSSDLFPCMYLEPPSPGPPPSSFYEGYPQNHVDPEDLWASLFPPYWINEGTPELDPMEFGCGTEGMDRADPTYRCGWNDLINFTGPFAPGQVPIDLARCTVATWKLTITASGGTATLEGKIGDDVVVTYSCEEFNCGGRSNFEMTTPFSELPCVTLDSGEMSCLAGRLPKQVCVVPYSSDAQHPCLTDQEGVACLCADPGMNHLYVDLSESADCHGELAANENSLPAPVEVTSGPYGTEISPGIFGFRRVLELPSWIDDPLFDLATCDVGMANSMAVTDFECAEIPDIEEDAPCGVFGPVLFDVSNCSTYTDYINVHEHATVADPDGHDQIIVVKEFASNELICDPELEHATELLEAVLSDPPAGTFGPYWVNVSTSYSRKLLAYVYCNGDQWLGKVYCMVARNCCYTVNGYIEGEFPAPDYVSTEISREQIGPTAASCALICDQIAEVVEYCPGVTSFIFHCEDFADSPCCEPCISVETECCGELPATLTATFEAGDNCDDIEGETMELVWNPATERWEGTKAETVCGVAISLNLRCVEVENVWVWYLSSSAGVCGSVTNRTPSLVECSPLELLFVNMGSTTNLACLCCDSSAEAASWNVRITL